MRVERRRYLNQGLKRFFHWLTLRTFQDLQIQDREVADYVSDLLASFARTERLYGIRDAQGRPLEGVVEMLLELERSPAGIREERDFFQEMGDYLLFMVGIFKEYVESHGFLEYYLTEGSRSYRRVWELEQGLLSPKTRLFERLWRYFEYNAGALHYMRKTFFRETPTGDPFDSWHRRVLLLAN